MQGARASWTWRLGRLWLSIDGDRTRRRRIEPPVLASGLWSFGIEDASQGCEFDEPAERATEDAPGVRAVALAERRPADA